MKYTHNIFYAQNSEKHGTYTLLFRFIQEKIQSYVEPKSKETPKG
jgi:hypothetical protein